MAKPQTQKRKHLSARNHQEAYDLWATHYADPALMTNRDGKATARKMARIAERLPLTPGTDLLDVGPGDGALFRQLAVDVGCCCGVDPSQAAIDKLRGLLADFTNVEFALGSATDIPYEDDTFDVVVINSVLHMFSNKEEIVQAMRELKRVVRPAGVIYVGELPFRSELGKGVIRHLGRKLYEYGLGGFLRLLFTIYLKPLLRGEPMLTYPATNLHIPVEEFRAQCSTLGFDITIWRHEEWSRSSLTRNDYLLTPKMT